MRHFLGIGSSSPTQLLCRFKLPDTVWSLSESEPSEFESESESESEGEAALEEARVWLDLSGEICFFGFDFNLGLALVVEAELSISY